jgi:predicted transposase YbfD/YdcC
MLLTEILNEVPDPRGYNAPHDLTDLLFVALAAMLCGAANCTEFALFCEGRLELLRRFVPLGGGVPSHDTFSRVLRMLDPEAFNTAFRRFMAAFGEQARIDTRGHLAVDGKSLKRAYDKGRAHMPPMMVTVFNCDTFMSLSQAITETGGEAQAAIKALNLLSLKGCTVTADALHCHRRMTQTIRNAGGDYVLAIKGNQSKLAAEAAAALDAAEANPRTPIHETEERAHGRHEIRRVFVTRFKQTQGPKALVDLAALARVTSERTVEGKLTTKTRTYALSTLMPPDQLLRTIRRHWGIENDLHWQLDVMMQEDRARNRKDNAPANLGLLRRLAMNVLRKEPAKAPLNHKQLKARWNDDAFTKLMTHMR